MPKTTLVPLLLSALISTASAGSSTLSARPQGGASSHDPEEILRRGGCMLCHRWTRQWIGPSFAELSRQYRGIGPQGRQVLVMRLRTGAVGNHTPFPIGPCDVTRISDEELALIVDYIVEPGSRPEAHAP